MLINWENCLQVYLNSGWNSLRLILGALCGYSQITTLVIISYDRFVFKTWFNTTYIAIWNLILNLKIWNRYNVIVKGFNGAPLTFSKAVMLITFSWIWSFGWSVSPLVGWGYYAMDGMLGT
jgi:r-opsin